MSFTQLERALADIKTWTKDLKSSTELNLKSELTNNVAPMLETVTRACMAELKASREVIEEQADVIAELIEHEGDFLQPEMGANITATLLLGLGICELLESIEMSTDDLNAKKLKDACAAYKQNATILLEQVEEITLDDGEDEDGEHGDRDDNDDAPIHGEGTGTGEPDGRGEGDDPGVGGGSSEG
jgi:hypothetical protein